MYTVDGHIWVKYKTLVYDDTGSLCGVEVEPFRKIAEKPF